MGGPAPGLVGADKGRLDHVSACSDHRDLLHHVHFPAHSGMLILGYLHPVQVEAVDGWGAKL